MITIGMKGASTLVVTENLLATTVGSGQVRVYATPMMIAGMEGTAAASVAPALDAGKTTVGLQVNISHVAATPLGMTVRFETELTEIAPNGKVLTFKIAAFDEKGLIGEGTHQRAIVDLARFEEKALAKLN